MEWVDANTVARILKAMGAQGIDTASICEDLAIVEEDLAAPNAVVRRHVVFDVFAQGLKRSGGTHLGLRLAEQAPTRAGFFAYLSLSCATVGDWLESLSRYQRIISPYMLFSVHSSGDRVWLNIGVGRGAAEVVAHILEYVTVLILRQLHEMAEHPLTVHEVHFPHSPLGDLREYRRVLGCDARFEESACRIILPSTDVSLRSSRASPAIEQQLRRSIEWVLAEREGEALPERIRKAIVDSVLEGKQSTQTSIARAIGMSARSLQRGLRAEGTTIRSLRQEVITDLARALLGSSRLSVKEVADRLGFARTSSFTRAFKRETGESPIHFRSRIAVEIGSRAGL